MRTTAELTTSGLETNPHLDPRVARAAFERGDPAAVAELFGSGLLRRPGADEAVDPARTLTVRFSDGMVTAAGREVGTLDGLSGRDPGPGTSTMRLRPRSTVMLTGALRESLGMDLPTAVGIARQDGATLTLDAEERNRFRVALVERCGAENHAVAKGHRHDVTLRTVDSVVALEHGAGAPELGRAPDRARAALVARMVAGADDGRGLGRTPDGERIAVWALRPDVEAMAALGAGRRPSVDNDLAFELHRLGGAVTTPVYGKRDGEAFDTGTVKSGTQAAGHLLAGWGSNAQRRVWVDRDALDAAPTATLAALAGIAEDRREDRDRARMVAAARESRSARDAGTREAG